MKKVGFIGWRGMVGSVLMGRMEAEHDFDGSFEPHFFSTSQSGGAGPSSASIAICRSNCEAVTACDAAQDASAASSGTMP